MYILYSLVTALLFVAALPIFLWRDRGTGRYTSTFRERMGTLPAALNAGRTPSIWVHAVSVGEVIAARPLILGLKARFPGHRVFVSTTTRAGQTVARATLGVADGLFYAPFDWAGPVRRVLKRLNPALLVLMETELWPNLLREARRAGARVAVVNGRISPRSFPRYLRIRSWLPPVLAHVDRFLMQSEADAERIKAIGAPADRVVVSGNLKFDAPEPEALPPAIAALVTQTGPLWVAGSTVAGEEEIVLAAFRKVREGVPDLRLIVAARHPERFASVPPLVEAVGLRVVRRSQLQGGWRDGDVLVLDTLGELPAVYGLATVVFVGGSLMPSGGHNVLEPAAWGKAVIVGPHMENFQAIADTFRAAGALVQIPSGDALAAAVGDLLSDPVRREALGQKARDVLARERGALGRTLDALTALLS